MKHSNSCLNYYMKWMSPTRLTTFDIVVLCFTKSFVHCIWTALCLFSDARTDEFELFSKGMDESVQRLNERCRSYWTKFDTGNSPRRRNER